MNRSVADPIVNNTKPRPSVALWLAATFNLVIATNLIIAPVITYFSPTSYFAAMALPVAALGIAFAAKQFWAVFRHDVTGARFVGWFDCVTCGFALGSLVDGLMGVIFQKESFWKSIPLLAVILLTAVLFFVTGWINFRWSVALRSFKTSSKQRWTWQFSLREAAFAMVFVALGMALIGNSLARQTAPIPLPRGVKNVRFVTNDNQTHVMFVAAEQDVVDWIHSSSLFAEAHHQSAKFEELNVDNSFRIKDGFKFENPGRNWRATQVVEYDRATHKAHYYESSDWTSTKSK